MARASAEKPPTCSIIIPVFDNCFYTRLCLQSLRSTRSTGPAYEIIVVDNGSTDGTARVLEHFGGDIANIICNRDNRGFAKASNQGAAAARGKYLVFLNNDVVVEPGWLAAMVTAAERDPAIGVVGARLLYPDGTLQHAGIMFGPDRHARHAYAGFPAEWPEALEAREYQAVTGACTLVDRRLFEITGRFEEGYVNSHEDVDLCFKVRQAGRKIYYCPDAVAFHFESVTSGRTLRDDLNSARFQESWRETVVVDYLPANDPPRVHTTKARTGHVVAELTQENSHLVWENVNLRRLMARTEEIALGQLVASIPPIAGPPRRDLLYCPGRIRVAVAGRTTRIPVSLVNLGSNVVAPGTLSLSYHWRRPEAEEYEVLDGLRTNIDESLETGQVVTVLALVAFPAGAGRFILEWDAVEDGVAWLSQEGVPTYRQSITVRDAPLTKAAILDLPLTLSSEHSLSVDVRLSRKTGPARDGAGALSLRWLAAHQTDSDASEMPLDPPEQSRGNGRDEIRRARLTVPSCEGSYRLSVGEIQTDGAWIPLETVGGATEIVLAPDGAVSSHHEVSNGRRPGGSDPPTLSEMTDDGQFQAEEAEYYRTRVRQVVWRLSNDLKDQRQSVDRLARLVEGYRNGRVMRALGFLNRIKVAVSWRRPSSSP